MDKYANMSQEVKDYANKKILESGIRMVPGHYPAFESKEQVDAWLSMMEKSFKYYFDDDTDI